MTQKTDLEKQKGVFSALNPDMLLSDIGSGINFNKPGFKKLIQLLLTGQIQKIIIIYPDRFLRFGFSLIENLAQDLITIITVFSSKLYGKRSHQHKGKQAIII